MGHKYKMTKQHCDSLLFTIDIIKQYSGTFSFNLPCIITLFTISIHCVTYNRIHMNKRQYIAGQFVQTTGVINSRWQCFSFHRSFQKRACSSSEANSASKNIFTLKFPNMLVQNASLLLFEVKSCC